MKRNICKECSEGALGCKDCCTSPFIEKDPGFWLTLSDIARIVKKTGKNPDEFCHIYDFKDCEEEDDETSDEIYGELMCIGDKTILMKGNGKCFFVNCKGCSIFDVRPMMCRIHPFWFKEEDGDIKITVEHEDEIEEDDCLITKENYNSDDIKHLLSLMGETEEGMKKLIRQYIEEMKLHNKYKHQLEEKSIMDVLKDNGFLD